MAAGTLTGRAGLGFNATGAPVTLTWVVMGLMTPAWFWVTIVLVTDDGAGVDNVGLAVVTRGPLGLKLTAAMGAADLT